LRTFSASYPDREHDQPTICVVLRDGGHRVSVPDDGWRASGGELPATHQDLAVEAREKSDVFEQD
jgi:hypothetical protein